MPIDATSRIVGSSIGVGAGPTGIAVTGDALWVANALDLTISRVDLVSGHVTQTVSVGDGPNAIVADADAVWVANEFDGTVTRIDPSTGSSDPSDPTWWITAWHGAYWLVAVGRDRWVCQRCRSPRRHLDGRG